MVPEAMRAAYILKRDYGYETRVLNLHTLKPIDTEAIIRAAEDTGVVITAEEHQIGALRAGQRHPDRNSATLRCASDHGSDWSEGPFRGFGRALGVNQGIRSERRTHRRKAVELMAFKKKRAEEKRKGASISSTRACASASGITSQNPTQRASPSRGRSHAALRFSIAHQLDFPGIELVRGAAADSGKPETQQRNSSQQRDAAGHAANARTSR